METYTLTVGCGCRRVISEFAMLNTAFCKLFNKTLPSCGKVRAPIVKSDKSAVSQSDRASWGAIWFYDSTYR